MAVYTDDAKRKSGYQALFNTPSGQQVLTDMIRQFDYLKSGFSRDPLEMAESQGKRHVIAWIMHQINDKPMRAQEVNNQWSAAYPQVEQDYVGSVTD